jgi:hypothetical protein
VPTYEWLASFERDLGRLSSDERDLFQEAVTKFVEDLKSGCFRKGLRVKGLQSADGIFELTWANDGRATFQYGDPRLDGEAHIIWRRVGGHDIFETP